MYCDTFNTFPIIHGKMPPGFSYAGVKMLLQVSMVHAIFFNDVNSRLWSPEEDIGPC